MDGIPWCAWSCGAEGAPMVIKSKMIRVGGDFDMLRSQLKNELQGYLNCRVSDRELTDSMSQFIKEENIDARMINRAKFLHKTKRRRLF